MTFRLFLPLCTSLLFLSATCERPVDLDLAEPNPRMVVISNFTVGQKFQVQVSRTRSVLEEDGTVFILDADVEIYEGEEFLEELKLFEPAGMDPFYGTTDLRAEAGRTYTIRAAAPGYPPVAAQSRIPAPIEIQSLEVSNLTARELAGSGETEYAYRVALGFQDPAEEMNYYHLRFYQQVLEYRNGESGDTLITGGILRPIEFNRAGDNNAVTTYFDGGVLFEDAPFNGQFTTYAFQLRTAIVPKYQLMGNMYAELRSVSEEYYLFHTSLSRQQESPGAPFSEPVIVFNNIENGRGIFAGYNVTQDSVAVLPE